MEIRTMCGTIDKFVVLGSRLFEGLMYPHRKVGALILDQNNENSGPTDQQWRLGTPSAYVMSLEMQGRKHLYTYSGGVVWRASSTSAREAREQEEACTRRCGAHGRRSPGRGASRPRRTQGSHGQKCMEAQLAGRQRGRGAARSGARLANRERAHRNPATRGRHR